MDTTPLGILGLGSRTTSFYLSELNRLYHDKKGGYSTCPLLLLNTNFNAINSLLPHPSKTLNSLVQQYLFQLNKLNIAHLLIPNITLHETIDDLSFSTNLIHPVSTTVLKIKQKPYRTIVLFGSLYSMQSPYLNNLFKSNNITPVYPSEEDMLFIDQFRKHVYNQTETKALTNHYHNLIANYTKTHPVVLACTELSILKPKNAPNLFDMAQIQIETAINRIT